MESVVFILFFIGILLAICNPLIGLYAFFIIAYLRPQDFYPEFAYIEPAKWILVATFISFALNKLLRREKFVKASQNWAILGILALIFISRWRMIDTFRWWEVTEDFLRVCMVFFLFINLINTSKRLKNFYLVFLLINLFVALRFYIAYRAGTALYWGSKPGDLSLGFLANADDLGIGLVIILSFALIPVFYAKNIFLKGLCALASVCFVLGMLATHSRGALFGALAVFIAAIISQMKMVKLRKNKFAIGMFIVLLLFAGFIYKYRHALQGSFESSQNESDAGRMGRLSTWAAAKQMIKDSPMFGVGRGNYVTYWKMHYPPGVFGYQVAHNIIFEVAAEIGLLGLLFFLYFSLYGLKEVRRITKYQRENLEKNYFLDMIFTIYIIALIGFYINGMFITVAFYWHIYILVAMFISAKTIFMKQIAYEK